MNWVQQSLRFVPIDDGARDGQFHLLRDVRGHQHCGQWRRCDPGYFAYSSGRRIVHEVIEYAGRPVVQT